MSVESSQIDRLARVIEAAEHAVGERHAQKIWQHLLDTPPSLDFSFEILVLRSAVETYCGGSVLPLDPAFALEHGLCMVCGLPIAVGDWPCVETIRPHGKSVQTDPFAAYFDLGLGKEITSLGDRWQAMKAEPGTELRDGRGRLEYRDHPSKGELSARRDRAEERRKEQQRGQQR